MEAGVILLILGLGLLGGSALLAFSWAARSGQFDDLDAAARVIFEPGELENFDAEKREAGDAPLGGDSTKTGGEARP